VSTPTPLVLPPLATPVREVWHALLDLAEVPDLDWTVIGGQMVLLHGLEHQQQPPVISQDGDVVGNLRTDKSALRRIVEALQRLEFTLDASPQGVAHRYVRAASPRDIVIDVLAQDNLGQRANLTTTPPGRTLEAPGTSQALERTERVLIEHEGRQAQVPRPSLLGAIIGKAAACKLPDNARHHQDLAFLCTLVADPYALAEHLSAADRRKVRAVRALQDQDHAAWRLIGDEGRRTDGWTTFTELLGTP
jgi:hypothetical protein